MENTVILNKTDNEVLDYNLEKLINLIKESQEMQSNMGTVILVGDTLLKVKYPDIEDSDVFSLIQKPISDLIFKLPNKEGRGILKNILNDNVGTMKHRDTGVIIENVKPNVLIAAYDAYYEKYKKDEVNTFNKDLLIESSCAIVINIIVKGGIERSILFEKIFTENNKNFVLSPEPLIDTGYQSKTFEDMENKELLEETLFYNLFD